MKEVRARKRGQGGFKAKTSGATQQQFGSVQRQGTREQWTTTGQTILRIEHIYVGNSEASQPGTKGQRS